MVDFFLRDEDERKAAQATHLDDIDLVPSKIFSSGVWGPAIVTVAVKFGEHVCWQCGGHFEMVEGPLKATEIKHGYAIILLHRKCVGVNRLSNKSSRSFDDIIRGVQARRFAAKSTQELAKAAASEPEK